jgi:hypothetical protein
MVAFYKHDIPHWMDGTESLSDGAYRAYHVIIGLIYLQEGPIVLNERGIAGRCNQRRDRFRRNLQELVDAGKLRIVGGKIENTRANDEIAKIEAKRKRIANGRVGDHSDIVEAASEHIRTDKPLDLLSADQVPTPIDKTRQEEKKTPPTPPAGGSDASEAWTRFKASWPIGSDLTPQAEATFAALSEPDRAAAVARVPGYVQEARVNDRKLCTARRFLAERRWEGVRYTPPPPPSPNLFIKPSTDPQKWAFWKAFYATQAAQGDRKARSSLAIMTAREPNDNGVVVPRELPKQLGAEAAE